MQKWFFFVLSGILDPPLLVKFRMVRGVPEFLSVVDLIHLNVMYGK